MPKCIELLPCDWLISNLCYQAIEQVYLIKWPVSVYIYIYIYIYITFIYFYYYLCFLTFNGGLLHNIKCQPDPFHYLFICPLHNLFYFIGNCYKCQILSNVQMDNLLELIEVLEISKNKQITCCVCVCVCVHVYVVYEDTHFYNDMGMT